MNIIQRGTRNTAPPEFCRQLLERVLDVKISEINYPEGEKSLEAQLMSNGMRIVTG